MSSPFVGEIRIFGCNFPPTGWAFCNGQLMPLSQNTALFSLLGTFYGGDGKSTFALPNIQDSAPMNQGQGSGLSDRFLGEVGGEPFVTLLTSELPVHQHQLMATATPGEVSSPTVTTALARSTGKAAYHSPDGAQVPMSQQTIALAGSGFPHNNLMPYLTLNFCIALQGVFPPRQ